MKNNNFLNKWFTLVELVVTISVLAILATVAFIWYAGYITNARDSTRDSDLKTLESGLNLYLSKSATYPLPESYTTITASWTTIRYQWLFWKSILSLIDFWNVKQWWGTDPKTKEYYGYVVNSNKKDYQIAGYFEKQFAYNNSILPQANAIYKWAYIRSVWDDLWFIVDNTTKKPIHETMAWISFDSRNATLTYDVVFSQYDIITWTWLTLFSNIYTRDDRLLQNKSLANLDNSLVWYWDMESTIMSWSYTLLDDLSGYWNNWWCYNWVTQVNCWNSSTGPQKVISTWKTWNAMSFDWIDDYIKINTITDNLQFQNKNTVIVRWKVNILSWTQNFISKHVPLFVHLLDNKFGNWVILNSTDAWQWLYSNNSVNIWQYYNFVSRRNNTTKILDQFIDNNYLSKIYSNSIINTGPSWSNLFIWADYDYNRYYLNWSIDEIRVYNRALSDNEISALYRTTK